jgi:hypothetical protein
MITFPNIAAYIAYLETRPAAMEAAAPTGIKAACDVVLEATRENIGVYQRSDTHPFEEWPELSEATKADRLAHGYSENDPLLRSGGMRDTYEISVAGTHGAVGSDDMIAFWQEFGTTSIPARSHVGMAGARNEERCSYMMAEPVIAALVGGVLP